MSPSISPSANSAAGPVADDRLYRLSDAQYRRMEELGIVAPGDDVEMSEGLLLRKQPPSGRHAARIYRLSVGQYREMSRLGVLDEDEPVELLDGYLVLKMGKNPPHVVATKLAYVALSAVLPAGWHVAKEDPIVAITSEPEPDLAVLRGGIRDYLGANPRPIDIAFLIEVSDTSLREDQTLKKQIYAAAGILIYWIVNLPDRRIEVYTEPSGPADLPGYRLRRDFGPGEAVPVIIEGREVRQIAVAELLP